MASAAKIGDLCPGRDTLERAALGQLQILLERVAAVAIMTAQPELSVDICAHRFRRSLEGIFQFPVAFEARIFLGGKG